MLKLLKLLFFFLMLSIAIFPESLFAETNNYVQVDSDSINNINNTPDKLIGKITPYVIAQGKSNIFNEGTKDEGIFYTIRFYSGYAIYVVEVYRYIDGSQSFSIDFYDTNFDFTNISNPADVIARELMYGPPKIFMERHMHTDRTNGS